MGTQELIIVLLIALVIFGGSQLPKLARSLGQAKNEFQKGLDDPTKAGEAKADDPKAEDPDAARIAALEQELQDLKRSKDDKGTQA